ncbi:MAG: sigma-70 family RNA polymerase sigma factor [Gemmataceae bacterium]
MPESAQTVRDESPLTTAVRRAIATVAVPDDPDDELLCRFVGQRDAVAFHALVRRHGGIVWAVCRGVLRNDADAEDAFQATFLVLATKAATVRNPRALAGWLYGVADRVARKARTARYRRRWYEGRMPERTEAKPADDAEERRVLHEELGGLPPKYRLPLVLHYFDGRTQDDAAGALGLSKSGIKKRLDRGRELLRARLVRRGLASTLTPASVPSVSAALAASTAAIATGDATVPAGVLALTAQGVTSMALVKMAAAASLVLAATFGVVLMAQPTPTPAPPPDKNPPPAVHVAPQSDRAWKERTVIMHGGHLIPSVAFRPDGKALAVGGTNGRVTAYDTTGYTKQWDTDVGGNFASVAYSWDGQTLGATVPDGVRLLDAATGKAGDMLEKKGSRPTAVAFFPDRPRAGVGPPRKQVVFGNARGYVVKSWMVWPQVGTLNTSTVAAGKEPADRFAVPLAVDPAGRCAVMTGPVHGDTGKNVLWAYVCGDYDAGSPGNRLIEGHKATVTAAAWSKDGSTLVTGDAEGVVIVWNGKTLQEKSKVGFDHRVAALAVTADGSRVAAAIIGNLQLQGGDVQPAYHELVFVWDPRTPAKNRLPLPVADRAALQGSFAGVASLAFAPDGQTLAAAFYNEEHLKFRGILVGTVRVWAAAEKP